MKQKHFALQDFHKDNWRLYEKNPDRNFSPERNYAIINETIKEYEKMRYGVDPNVTKAAGNVADIMACYGVYRLGGGGTKKLEQYLGKDWMKRIYGERLMDKIKAMKAYEKLQIAKGNDKYKDYILN
jgi:hypothetical protein